MKELFSNKEKIEKNDLPPYKCRICGLGNIENSYEICEFCGWEDDDIQNDKHDYMGGANKMSFNQYKKFWEENKVIILNSQNKCFTAIDLAKKYFQNNFTSYKN